MTSPTTSGDERAAAVRAAIEGATVGDTELHGDITSLGGIGDVEVADGTASVELTLPVPSESLRSRLVTAIEAAAVNVDGISSVTVSAQPRPADPGERIDMLPEVKNVVAVASGKGGVGKTTVATNLAVALADAGASVGLLDADIYGPNIPSLLGLDEATPRTTMDDDIVPRERHGVRVMSTAFITDEDDPVIWRGPLVDEFIKQLVGDVAWGQLDYLVVDMPPGTGDAQLSLVQHLPVAGTVIVTTPQEVAVDDAARGLVGFARYDVPILGVVENMASFECPDCGDTRTIFGSGGTDDLAEQFEIPVLGRIPLDPAAGTLPSGDDSVRGGLDIPLLGRLQLPRTKAERDAARSDPPLAIRPDGGTSREQLRMTATSIAARVNQAANRFDG